MVKRYVWASTRARPLHGHVRPNDAFGTDYELEAVEVGATLRAFDSVTADPGTFTIVTRDQSRIDFHFARAGNWGAFLSRFLPRREYCVTLDIWFEDDPDPPLVDVHTVSAAEARRLVEQIFQDCSDRDLRRFLGLPKVAA